MVQSPSAFQYRPAPAEGIYEHNSNTPPQARSKIPQFPLVPAASPTPTGAAVLPRVKSDPRIALTLSPRRTSNFPAHPEFAFPQAYGLSPLACTQFPRTPQKFSCLKPLAYRLTPAITPCPAKTSNNSAHPRYQSPRLTQPAISEIPMIANAPLEPNVTFRMSKTRKSP